MSAGSFLAADAGPVVTAVRTGHADAGGRGAAITFQNVTKAYGKVTAVADINIQIKAGEFLTLLGPSGSGKSTLLMLLAGFERPTSGEIFVDGKPTSNVPSNRRNQGVVFQNYALFPHMRVYQNLAFPLSARGISGRKAKQMIEYALDITRIGQFADRYPSQLSGGQQQRVALARALVFNPPLLLMDESLSALDRNLREEMQLELKALHQQLSSTIVFVTHDQGEALTMSDRIAVLREGSLVQIDCPASIYRNPSDRFVAGFMGDANFIPCRITAKSGDAITAVTETGEVVTGTSEKLAQGEEALAVVRPEAVSLAPEARHDTEGKIAIPGVVERFVFAGESKRYWVRTGGERLVHAKIPNSASAPSVVVGEKVNVYFDRADVTFIRP